MFFRSQHERQSWVATLTAILDVSSIVMVRGGDVDASAAQLTFAMARHAAVDLTQVVNATYDPHRPDRLSPEGLEQLRKYLADAGMRLKQDETADQKLAKLRSLYEPYCAALAQRLLLSIPPWQRSEVRKDNWQSGPWDRVIQAKGLGEGVHVIDDHF
jgi:hypothetical protein